MNNMMRFLATLSLLLLGMGVYMYQHRRAYPGDMSIDLSMSSSEIIEQIVEERREGLFQICTGSTLTVPLPFIVQVNILGSMQNLARWIDRSDRRDWSVVADVDEDNPAYDLEYSFLIPVKPGEGFLFQRVDGLGVRLVFGGSVDEVLRWDESAPTATSSATQTRVVALEGARYLSVIPVSFNGGARSHFKVWRDCSAEQ